MMTLTLEQQKGMGLGPLYVKNGVITRSNGDDYMSSANFLGRVIDSSIEFHLYDEDGYFGIFNSFTGAITVCTKNENYCDEEELPEAKVEKEEIFRLFKKYKSENWKKYCW